MIVNEQIVMMKKFSCSERESIFTGYTSASLNLVNNYQQRIIFSFK